MVTIHAEITFVLLNFPVLDRLDIVALHGSVRDLGPGFGMCDKRIQWLRTNPQLSLGLFVVSQRFCSARHFHKRPTMHSAHFVQKLGSPLPLCVNKRVVSTTFVTMDFLVPVSDCNRNGLFAVVWQWFAD